jgi:ParB family chromosome partitioning protein
VSNPQQSRRLGRGLEALLGRPPEGPAAAAPSKTPSQVVEKITVPSEGLTRLPMAEIDRNPFQPRKEYDEAALKELTDSLKEHGLLQPIVVRRVGARYQLIAGERRLRAAEHAGWTSVAVQVREADDRQVAELAIVENLQRRDLSALEKAASFQQYLERWKTTQEELANRLKIDRSTVANLIRLLELPKGVQDALRVGNITPGHARAMLPLGDEREQLALCQKIAAESLSVRATEELVSELIRTADAEPLSVVHSSSQKSKGRRAEQLAKLEQDLRHALGTKVELKQSAAGNGKIIIHFRGNEEFERLLGDLTDRRAQRRAG